MDHGSRVVAARTQYEQRAMNAERYAQVRSLFLAACELAEGEIGAVLRGQRRQVQHRAGDVDALAVRDHAAGDDFGIDEIGAQSGDADANPAVVDQEIIAGRDRLGIFGYGWSTPWETRVLVDAAGKPRLSVWKANLKSRMSLFSSRIRPEIQYICCGSRIRSAGSA